MHKPFPLHITTLGMLALTIEICINRVREGCSVSLRKYALAITLI